MMSQFNARRFGEAVNNYESGKYSQALKEFQALSLEIIDPWDTAEVLYHEIITLEAVAQPWTSQ